MNKNHFFKVKIVFLLFLFVNFWSCRERTVPYLSQSLVNLSQLNNLYEEVEIDGKQVAIIHIYSEYPDYGWVDAQNEGIACVDDAARAAVVYLRHFEIKGDENSLNRARKLIDFCRYMQAEDGLFFNFIYNDYSINQKGETSFKSFGWWAARALWALGEGFRIFNQIDADYAKILEHHIKQSFFHIDTLLANYPEMETINGFDVPKWLLYNSAADATSELMLGLSAYARSSGDLQVKKYLRTFAEGIIQMQAGDEDRFPYGIFLSWRNVWHGWANGQTQALAYMSPVIENDKFKNAAMREANFFYPYWIRTGFPREFKFTKSDSFRFDSMEIYQQIAYNLRPAVVGALKLYDLTKDEKFARLAGYLATWFFGNNPAKVQMYDPQTGRCFDGILSETEINRNSGAESTIEALYSILEVEANKMALQSLKNFINSQHQ